MLWLKRTIAVITILTSIHISKSELHPGGILFPRDSETREVISLDGVWNFVVQNISRPFDGFQNYWYKESLLNLDNQDILLMPVPASYNDITTNPDIRDHVGLVWYDRHFFVPKHWADIGRVWLRFGSVSYAAQVWINGELVMNHEIGHLPFHAEVTKYLLYEKENLITVACDNTLLADTVPQGQVKEIVSGRLTQTYSFDFFNYAGIDRPVKLYTTPSIFIDDIVVQTELNEDSALVHYNISIIGNNDEPIICNVSLLDKHNNLVASSGSTEETSSVLTVDKPNLWWPYLMDSNPGYLYKLQVQLQDASGNLIDKYVQAIGLRTISWTNTSLLINNIPIYLHGFGRHEDSDIRGKGLDLPLIIRDYNLIKWIGANTYRTSHYPYAEEIMDLADAVGIMIVNECPSVNTEFFLDSMLVKHKRSLSELINRDKNRPSVIMWSGANEPRTQSAPAKEYFQSIIAHIKTLDTSRPTTIVEAQGVDADYSAQFVDIVSFNRYNAWYTDAGELDIITVKVVEEATAWHKKHNKPVIMMEYGADTLEGLHFLPDFIWSEEYQVNLMSQHFAAFDILRESGFFIGEYIWNFADFKTAQTFTRVGGNKKGIFTRNREPKLSAFHLRKRYWSLAHEYNNASLPLDLEPYVISSQQLNRDEL